METFYVLITHYGYFGIFTLLMLGIVGLPVPDETLLTISGYLISHGELKLIPTFLAAFLGSITGISISYAIGNTFGHHVLQKYGHYINITAERLEKTHAWFEKIGRWALLVGYFIPGIRHIVAIIAGASQLEMWEFALFAYSGGFIWTTAFLSIGYFFGTHWQRVLHVVTHDILLFTLAAIVATVVVYFMRKAHGKVKR